MEFKTLFRKKGQFSDEAIILIDNNEGSYYGDGFNYSITKSTAYRYAKILKEGGRILVNRYGNNKIIY